MSIAAANSEIEHATELVRRIEAMVNAPYWNSQRRITISECAQRATRHLATAKECLLPNTPTSSSSAGS